MPRIWNWDQGRLNYTRYENIRKIAQAFVGIENILFDVRNTDPLRATLESATGLPFAPSDYKVWRNYARVFESTLLATDANGRLMVSDICKKIAADATFDADDYLQVLIKRFRYPFPGFNDYNTSQDLIYPFCAILKYLFAKFLQFGEGKISLKEVFSLLIGNNCTGLENLQHYMSLRPTSHRPTGDQDRQVREMLIFLSQMSILKWTGGYLCLDLSKGDMVQSQFDEMSAPVVKGLLKSKTEEFMTLTAISSTVVRPITLVSREAPPEEAFTEGKKVRVSHLRVERSRILRVQFFTRNPRSVCNMCVINMRTRYPWTENLLDIHHVLPLASTIVANIRGTSLDDIVGLCPTCHRSVHAYYRKWLTTNSLEDFRSKQEAIEVYNEAKAKVQL